jgi:XRE family transcriptional regulator, fatty acid utilization regulator
MDFKEQLGKRIAQLRKSLRLSQENFAKKANLGHPQTVSQIENGVREVKAYELSMIASVLHTSIKDLLNFSLDHKHELVLWREKPDEVCIEIESNFLLKCKQFEKVEKNFSSHNCQILPQYPIDPRSFGFADAECLAHEISKQLNLGDRPGSSLEKILEENYNVKIFYKPLHSGSAASIKGAFGYAMLINSLEAPWRRNYNIAHELFHLITWDSVPSDLLKDNPELMAEMEKKANTFASALLLPDYHLNHELQLHVRENKINTRSLISIARKFEVSTEALVWRLVNIKGFNRSQAETILSSEEFRNEDGATMREIWQDPPTLPIRFVNLAFFSFLNGYISRSILAEYLDTTLVDLPNRLMGFGFDETQDYENSMCTA